MFPRQISPRIFLKMSFFSLHVQNPFFRQTLMILKIDTRLGSEIKSLSTESGTVKNSNSAVCLSPVARRVASLRHWLIDTIVLCVMPLSGWGKCCTWVDCTTLGRERFDLGPKPRVDFQNHERLPKEGILDMEWEKAHFQENARGYLAREHFTRCGDHRTLPLAEKICDRMDFLAANRLRVDKFESPARNGL